MATLLAVLSLAFSQAAPWSGPPISHVRPGHRVVGEIMARGYERSATFRRLVDGLEQASVIVFVRSGRCDGHVHACLQLLAADQEMRTLRATVNGFENGGAALLALIAHELQHAKEIAETDTVRDEASFRAFFRAHGWANAAGFETGAALLVARAVEREMAAKPE